MKKEKEHQPSSLKPGYRGLLLITVALLSALTALTVVESALRLFPSLLPLSYRVTLPVQGIELFAPGILARTPIEGIPLPYVVSSLYTGNDTCMNTVPADLQALGMVKKKDNPDLKRYPAVVLKVDKLGFPNAKVKEKADIVLLGDSFAVAAAVLNPPGLQSLIEERTGQSVYNLGISGTGPAQEEWLLEKIALSLKPHTIVWLFFGGNDILDAAGTAALRQQGIKTYADLYHNFNYPALYSLGWAKNTLTGLLSQKEKKPHPLPPVLYKATPLWFYPLYLRQLTRSTQQWKEDPGWLATTTILAKGAQEARLAGVHLIIAYVPSKAEVYLPLLSQYAPALYHMATFDAPLPFPDPQSFYTAALKNRNSLDQTLNEFCKEAGIPYLSLTPSLEQGATQGLNLYLSADTHWAPEGQKAGAVALLEELRKERRKE